MKTKKEIKSELFSCIEGIEESTGQDKDIYRGWAEALAFVLDIDFCRCGRIQVEGYILCDICLDKEDWSLAGIDGRE